MKKIVLLQCIVWMSLLTQAQTKYLPTGNWRWVNGKDTIDIFFKTDQAILNGVNYPITIGFHRYVKNGILLESTLAKSATVYTSNRYSIILFSANPQKVMTEGNMTDLTLNDKRYIMLTKVNSTTMDVYLTYLRGVRTKGTQGFTLPQHFTLIKQ